MTARPDRRRRRTLIGGLVGLALVAAGVGLSVVGANAVANSTEGETVATDDRRVMTLPATDNAALAIVDEQNRLTSLVVVTVMPDGRGGTVVTVPVSADVNSGLSDRRLALASVLDPDEPAAFFEQLEATLAITLQFGEIVGSDRLIELIKPTLPANAELPIDVVDAGDGDGGDGDGDGDGVVADGRTDGAGLIASSGDVVLDGPMAAAALRAIDVEVSERARHAIDVAVWSALADSAPAGSDSAARTDDVGRPVVAASIDEVFARLWSGPVQARDLALDPGQSDGSQPVLDAQAVVLDRRDTVLVFAQISPARTSTPNSGPVFRFEIPISDAQLIESDSGYASRRRVGIEVIQQMLFLQANVASVDAAQDPQGASQVTRIEVADASFVEAMDELGTKVFGEVDVVVAEQLIDGIDVVVRLGTNYLEFHALEADDPDSDAASATDGGPDASTTDDAGTVDADG